LHARTSERRERELDVMRIGDFAQPFNDHLHQEAAVLRACERERERERERGREKARERGRERRCVQALGSTEAESSVNGREWLCKRHGSRNPGVHIPAGKCRCRYRKVSQESQIESYPGGNQVANLKSIFHRCYLWEAAFEWELTQESIYLHLGCLESEVPSLGVTEMMRGATEGGSTYESWNPCLIALTCRGVNLHQPLSRNFSTHTTFKARLWPCLEPCLRPKFHNSFRCSLHARLP